MPRKGRSGNGDMKTKIMSWRASRWMARRRARPEDVTERGSINIDTDTRVEARMGKRGDTGIGIGTTGIMTNELQLPL
jgi:hypothetical protein